MSKPTLSPNSPIPFHSPSISDREQAYVLEALTKGKLSGDGAFTKRCHAWLAENLKAPRVLLTHSCTAALEMAALLCDLNPGDEVIMPSYTFVSTANAVALRHAVPVFVDIRMDTLNIDEKLIEQAITPKTKAIFVVHYAGVAAEMDAIIEIAAKHRLKVVEDAAQGLMSTYKGKALGTIGDFGAISFHETKNIVSGEGGALIVKSDAAGLRAEIIREKGTNRSQFFRGQIDKYTWVDLGSSYLPSDILAALLLAQLERAGEITERRLKIWSTYQKGMIEIGRKLAPVPAYEPQPIQLPVVPEHCQHNGHIFYFLTKDLATRTALIEHLKAAQIQAPFHYVPLHSSPGGRRYGRVAGHMSVTDSVADRIIRLPLFAELEDPSRVLAAIEDFFLGFQPK
ncbi:MAG: dTDP-4-amino-4,6-dideoxygalactose transaminase [Deltaproteobacteria bacterium]|jgi:dTDP-4-amino-4,6-dideoxygalactose transaminase|nr:dTDP-4-amino-4,6-dideoxygalactose transaminase [Deltaproteobacteria bacterium]